MVGNNVGVDYMELKYRLKVGIEAECTGEVKPLVHAMV